ncbi:MAG TPA: hypothetical protein ENN06_05385 [Desulfobacteraceae bacterium]|nr:hypothetical protein [Desulfobacteraceae bacterium]
MILFMEHDMLMSGPDRETCEQHIRLFFDKSQLVHYDSIDFDRANSVNGTDGRFEELLSSAIAGNRQVLSDLLNKLRQEGCTSLDDLLVMPQGFMSKLLHTMCHLLDGFFGVDSRFFDIDEISHWLTENRKQEIARSPEQCWLIRVQGRSVYGQGFEDRED